MIRNMTQRSSVRLKLYANTRNSQFIHLQQSEKSGLHGTHQDGEHGAHKRDGRRDGGQDAVLEVLNQPSCHGGTRKVCLMQQLQPHT